MSCRTDEGMLRLSHEQHSCHGRDTSHRRPGKSTSRCLTHWLPACSLHAVMETEMETEITMLPGGYIGIMENKMETTRYYRVILG